MRLATVWDWKLFNEASLKDTNRILVEHIPVYRHHAQDDLNIESVFVVKLSVFSVFRGPAVFKYTVFKNVSEIIKRM